MLILSSSLVAPRVVPVKGPLPGLTQEPTLVRARARAAERSMSDGSREGRTIGTDIVRRFRSDSLVAFA